ncbi:pilus protein [Enterococcus florum]|uniref:Pilus protein n=1 Tax=Enterococcus florum TaxID=2480627 RepID=A0A4P5PAP1_9ENTE|nr:SpaH/EbpB family LPXTG-anchored major pilin [Enterococcus florum]GCF94726.1 pilus protein [Enterococcus florum]
MKRKLMTMLAAAACIVPLATGVFGLGSTAEAAEEVNVTLHKKKMDEFPSEAIKNDGKINSAFDHFQGLEGVEYTPYDITEDFYKTLALTGNETNEQAKEKTENWMKSYVFNPSKATQAAPMDTTDDKGEVTFSGLEKRAADGTYKVYYFAEKLPSGYQHDVNPTILVLPAMDGSTELTDIHLYPKNKVTDKPGPEKILVDEDGNQLPALPAGEDNYTFEIGKLINYKASFNFPSQIGDVKTVDADTNEVQTRYNKFTLVDRVSKTGVKFEGISKVVINGKEIKGAELTEFYTHMTLTPYGTTAPYADAAGFDLAANLNSETNLTDAAKYATSKATADYLKQFAGQKIEIVYGISLTEHTDVDTEVKNDLKVNMTHDGNVDDNRGVDTPPPGVRTGGRKFFKHEAGKETQGLGGAEFAVVKEAGGKKYYLVQNAAKEATWVEYTNKSELSGATKFKSANDGTFEVVGLEYGEYALVEMKAPNGFLLLDDDFDFSINNGSYTETDALSKVANVSSGGFLPSTGGMGIVAFLVVGMGLMAVALMKYRRLHDQAI